MHRQRQYDLLNEKIQELTTDQERLELSNNRIEQNFLKTTNDLREEISNTSEHNYNITIKEINQIKPINNDNTPSQVPLHAVLGIWQSY